MKKRLNYDIEYLMEEGIFESGPSQTGGPLHFAYIKLTDDAKRGMETKRERIFLSTLVFILKSIPIIGKLF